MGVLNLHEEITAAQDRLAELRQNARLQKSRESHSSNQFPQSNRAIEEMRTDEGTLWRQNDALVTLACRQAELIKVLESEKNRCARDERDSVWKDISFSTAHKIGNPIFAIETLLDPLRKRVNENRTTEALQVIELMGASVEKAKDIVDQFKSLTRAQEIHAIPMLLRPILEEACSVAQIQGVSCNIQCSPEVEVLCDPERLAECFDELATNSLLWFDKPERQILVDVISPFETSFGSYDRYIRIQWGDNGAGVPDEEKERVFDAFFSTRIQGTGLGLALVRHIIEGHGGHIIENGEHGEGAMFMIYLPAKDARQTSKIAISPQRSSHKRKK